MRVARSAVTNPPDVESGAVREALEQLVDALAEQSESSAEPAHLARVRAASRARTVAAEHAEQLLDAAIVAARDVRPEGATWAQLGAVLGTSGQAVSKRAGQHSLTRARRQLTAYERAQRREQRYRELFGDNLPPEWRFTEAFETPREPASAPVPQPATPADTDHSERPRS